MPTDWGVNLLRLSIFCADKTTASDAAWKMLTGQDEAENRTSVPGGRSFSGAVSGGMLTLTHAGTRLDLHIQPKASETPDIELPIIGLWPDVRDTFDKMGEQLLISVQLPVIRLAVGAVLLAKNDSLEKSYELLKALLKSVQIDPKKTRDLHYRVNWAIDSKTAGRKVNRLTTWAAMRFTSALMQVTGDQVGVVQVAPEHIFTVRLECDHNTDGANKTPFAQADIVPTYKELLRLIEENAEKGEVLS